MKLLKKGISLLLVTALAVTITACGTSNSNNGTNNSTSTSSSTTEKQSSGEKVKISYWTHQRHDSDYIQSKIDKFNETNEHNIEVEMTVMADNYSQSLDLAFTSNQAPDVFNNPTVEFYEKGYVESIDDYIDPEMREKFASTLQNGTSIIDGKLLSLGSTGNTIRLVYNLDVFEELGLQPPKTIDEMVETAKIITEHGKDKGLYGWAMNYKNASSSLSRSMGAIAQLAGSVDGYDFSKAQFDYTRWKPIIEAFRQMYVDGSTLPGAESLDMDPLRAQFAEGNIGMYISYSFEPGVYADQFPAKIRWAAAEVPTVPGYEHQGIISTGSGTWLGMSTQSKHKQEAWEFMEFMYSNEVLVGYHETGYGLSIVPHVLEVAKAPQLAGMEYFIPGKYDGVWPVLPLVTPEGNSMWDDFLKYILVGGDLDKVVADVTDRYNSALEDMKADGKVIEPIEGFEPKSLQVAK